MSALADRIRAALAASTINQAELAAACGIKPPSVNDWLSGKTKSLKAHTAQKAASALGVRIAWLTYGTGPMRDQPGTQDDGTALRQAPTPYITKLQPKAPAEPEEIVEVLALMRNTDDRGRAMALAAVKVALNGYKPAKANHAS